MTTFIYDTLPWHSPSNQVKDRPPAVSRYAHKEGKVDRDHPLSWKMLSRFLSARCSESTIISATYACGTCVRVRSARLWFVRRKKHFASVALSEGTARLRRTHFHVLLRTYAPPFARGRRILFAISKDLKRTCVKETTCKYLFGGYVFV